MQQIRIKTDLTRSVENLVGGETKGLRFGHWTGAVGSLQHKLHPLQLEWDQFLSYRLGQGGGGKDTGPCHTQQLPGAQASARQCLQLSGAQSDSLLHALSCR